jgi:hypothetical protein
VVVAASLLKVLTKNAGVPFQTYLPETCTGELDKSEPNNSSKLTRLCNAPYIPVGTFLASGRAGADFLAAFFDFTFFFVTTTPSSFLSRYAHFVRTLSHDIKSRKQSLVGPDDG